MSSSDSRGSLILSLLGLPLSGKRTLARGLARSFPNLTVVDGEVVRTYLEAGDTACSRAAESLVAAGRLIPDEHFRRLLAEISTESVSATVLLIGLPRNVDQYRALKAATACPVPVAYLHASRMLLDERRRAAGFQHLETAHPGAFDRLSKAIAAVLDDAGMAGDSLVLDASEAPTALSATVAAFVATYKQ